MGAVEDRKGRYPIPVDGKRVLIIKLRYIGDTLSIIPVLDNLREKAPGAEIDVMVNRGTEEVLASHPGISRVWPYDRSAATKSLSASLAYHWELVRRLRARHYHAVIDYTHGDRASFVSFITGAKHRISYLKSSRLSKILMNNFIDCDPARMHIVDYQLEALRLFGVQDFRREIRVHIPETVQREMDRTLRPLGILPGGMNVAIHPGARGALRQWPQERFAAIAERLRSEYRAEIILLGGPSEKELVESVERLMGFPASYKNTHLSLIEMASVLSHCRVFIGNDSAPAHLAAAVGCRTVTLFGPTFPHMWKPLCDSGAVIFKNVDCCGCRQEECIRPDRTCMQLIETEEVWEAVKRVLEKSDTPPGKKVASGDLSYGVILP